MQHRQTNPRPSFVTTYQVVMLETDPPPEVVLETGDLSQALKLARRLNGMEEKEPLGTRATVVIRV